MREDAAQCDGTLPQLAGMELEGVVQLMLPYRPQGTLSIFAQAGSSAFIARTRCLAES